MRTRPTTDRKPLILAAFAAVAALATLGTGVMFQVLGAQEFGGPTRAMGYAFIVIPLGLATLGLGGAALAIRLAARRRAEATG